MPMLSLLGADHRLPLFHMDKIFIRFEETKESINKFSIGYMINPKLNINKAFRKQVNKFMNNKFAPITQPYISYTSKNITKVLALLIFMRQEIVLRKLSSC